MQEGRLLGEVVGVGIDDIELLLVEETINTGTEDVGDGDRVGAVEELTRLDVGVKIGGLEEGRQLAAVE